MMQQLDFLVGGPAGTGIESVAKSVALAFVREGLRVHAVSEYANVIRGDHSFSSVHVAGQTPLSHTRQYDLFLAMDARSVAEHAAEMREGGIIVCDAEKEKKIAEIDIPKGVHLLNVPMAALAREAGLALAANVVGVGACFALLERDNEKMRSVLETLFTRKGAEIVAKNHAALRAGMDAVEQNPDAPRLAVFIGRRWHAARPAGGERGDLFGAFEGRTDVFGGLPNDSGQHRDDDAGGRGAAV